jgi:flagellar hook-length control protein FliK
VKDVEPGSNREPLPAGQLNRIATAIIDEAFGAPAQSVPGAAKAQLASAFPASRLPVRNLTIQLHPVELGLLHVEMRAAAGTLLVKVRAAHAQTAKLLEENQDALSGLLRSAGHDLTALTVQVMQAHGASPALSPADNTHAPHAPSEGQVGSQGERSAGDQAARGEPGAERNSPRQGKQPDAHSSGQNGRRRDLYV